MRAIDEQQVALDCLRLANGLAPTGDDAASVVARAEAYLAFVTGSEDASARLKLVREAVS